MWAVAVLVVARRCRLAAPVVSHRTSKPMVSMMTDGPDAVPMMTDDAVLMLTDDAVQMMTDDEVRHDTILGKRMGGPRSNDRPEVCSCTPLRAGCSSRKSSYLRMDVPRSKDRPEVGWCTPLHAGSSNRKSSHLQMGGPR